MLDKYKESYDYVKSQAGDIKTIVTENKLGFFERFGAVPGFMKEGFAHISDVKAIYPLLILKLILMALVTGLSALATYYAIANLPTEQWAASLASTSPPEDIETWINIGIFTMVWAPYMALILLIEGVFNGAMGAATYLHEAGHPVTVGSALMIAKEQAPTIWKFRLIQQLFLMLTARGKNDGIATSLLKGAIRQAWNFGTAGMMPAILNGQTLVEAVKLSVEFLKTTPVKLISLILIKQVLGLLLVLSMAAIGFLVYETQIFPLLILLLPLFILALLIQPIYISMLFKLYAGFLKDNKYPLEVTPGVDSDTFTTWILGIYAFFTALVFFMGMV